MSYRLREGLSFCEIDNHLIFLDVQNDLYFRLPECAERAFIAHINGRDPIDTELSELLETEILVDEPSRSDSIAATRIEGPSRSAVEAEPSPHRLRFIAYLEVLAIVWSTRRRLRKQKLRDVIDKIIAGRQHWTDVSDIAEARIMEERLRIAASLFRHARRYVPVQASCLLDSLSMMRFLSRRRLPARLVFGVTLEPFSAHCWVQQEDLALNETVGDANAHTPIGVF